MTWGVCGESCSSFSSRPTHRHGVWCVDWYSVLVHTSTQSERLAILQSRLVLSHSLHFVTVTPVCYINQVGLHIRIQYNYIHMQNYGGTDWGEQIALWIFFKRLWLHKGPIMEGPGISERLPFLTLGRISWITTLSLHSAGVQILYYLNLQASFFGGSEGDRKDTETLATLGGRETLELFFVGAVALVVLTSHALVKRLCAGSLDMQRFFSRICWGGILFCIPFPQTRSNLRISIVLA